MGFSEFEYHGDKLDKILIRCPPVRKLKEKHLKADYAYTLSNVNIIKSLDTH